MKRGLWIPLFALFFVLPSSSAFACSCARPAPSACLNLAKSGQAVFIGRVIHVENVEHVGNGQTADGQRLSIRMDFNRHQFQIEEVLFGLKPTDTEVDVESASGCCACGYGFQIGEKYLVYANRLPGGKFGTSICTPTRPLSQAVALLPQLRAMRDGQHLASLYGVLRKRQQPWESVKLEGYDQVLPHTALRIADGENVYETRTDTSGVYSFFELPAGKFTVSAELPRGLELGQTISSRPLDPLRLPAGACYEHDVEAVPTGSIQGRVLDPQGKPLRYARLELSRPQAYKPDGYPSGTLGEWFESQSEKGFFQFLHVAPGDYLLVFNNRNIKDSDMPFPRTFYPDSLEQSKATVIHLSEGEQLKDVDIRLSPGAPTRTFLVRVQSGDGEPTQEASLSVRAAQGGRADPRKLSPGSFSVNLFLNDSYTFQAEIYCFSRMNVADADLFKSETRVVDGNDERVSELTLVIPAKSCPK